ncbi:MAG: hypothetical protein H7Z21_18950 [Hymenobacter sp.]|nr:hypothetical protein [Hymenobacter sp.]
MNLKSLFVLVMSGLLLAACQSHRYALPSPKGPPQPKVKKSAKSSDQNADGTAVSPVAVEVKPQKNSYGKDGLLNKPKYERRKLSRKVGQRKFLGFVLPF